jgi:hypothetical protein
LVDQIVHLPDSRGAINSSPGVRSLHSDVDGLLLHDRYASPFGMESVDSKETAKKNEGVGELHDRLKGAA